MWQIFFPLEDIFINAGVNHPRWSYACFTSLDLSSGYFGLAARLVLLLPWFFLSIYVDHNVIYCGVAAFVGVYLSFQMLRNVSRFFHTDVSHLIIRVDWWLINRQNTAKICAWNSVRSWHTGLRLRHLNRSQNLFWNIFYRCSSRLGQLKMLCFVRLGPLFFLFNFDFAFGILLQCIFVLNLIGIDVLVDRCFNTLSNRHCIAALWILPTLASLLRVWI
jgi:hypothetical protein